MVTKNPEPQNNDAVVQNDKIARLEMLISHLLNTREHKQNCAENHDEPAE